jgi:integrase
LSSQAGGIVHPAASFRVHLARFPTLAVADTGMRPEECFRLRWEAITWVNGRYGTLLVTHGKTAAARRTLPMTPRVRAIMESRWERAGGPAEGWVWPARTPSRHVEPKSIYGQHLKALEASKVRPFVLYSLGHTFLTRLGESGCDAWTLARIAGHSSVSVPGRYVHPSEDAVLTAISRLGRHKLGTVRIYRFRRLLTNCSQAVYSEGATGRGEVLEWPNRAAC